jgi:uncharacterized protein YfaT (DUF1175 family)
MKKSKVFAAVLFVALFSSMFIVAQFSTAPSPVFAIGDIPVEEQIVASPELRPLGENGTMFVDMTSGYTITEDGDLADWVGADFEVFGGINLSVGYDATTVYVAAQWADATFDDDISHWNCTFNNLTSGDVTFDTLDGADDMFTFGFSDGTDYDLMTWMASLKGPIYEHDGDETADAGTLSFVENSNGTAPTHDNSSVAIADYSIIANGTNFVGWFDEATPTGSQTDVTYNVDWNNTRAGYYTAEFSRLLDTTNGDDLVLDFTDTYNNPLYFIVGSANADDALDLDITTSEYLLCPDNEVATLTFDAITNPVESSLLITGTVFDDYEGWDLIVYMDGWDITYFPGAFDYADVNLATGDWSYLFIFDQWDMPLGDWTVYVEFYPLYDASIQLSHAVTIEDNGDPQVLGIVDLNERFPYDLTQNLTGYDGADGTNVIVTIGAGDNYWASDLLDCELFWSKDGGATNSAPMAQFSAGGTTFTGNLSIADSHKKQTNNYTYWVTITDPSGNSVTSDEYWFIVGTNAVVPGFGFIAAIVGLLGASFIVYKKFKK